MKPTEQTCDTSLIDQYLEDRLDDFGQEQFEQHLGDCQSCQEELQRRAAEPGMWRDAVELLGGTSGEPAGDSFDVSDDDRRQRHALSVLDSLTATDDPEMLGRIGDYEISGVVGVGGMGAVLKGFDKSLRRVVAIKVMAPHLADSGPARTRFQREARAAAAITHDNVIDTYGVSEANGLPYLVMPFARGPSLQRRIDESGPLTAVEVVRIGRQIASGLAAAHEQGLVHRDIKPANILLNEGIERLWITDFGVARAMDDASMTQTGVIAGTPQYMSPEQARGESVDHRSDLFSMGSVLYTACTGRPPFRSEAAYGILRRITDTDPRPIRDINPEIPEWLSRVIERLMAKHPSDRYQTAGEVAELMEGCLAHLQQPTLVELPRCVRPSSDSVEAKSKTSPQEAAEPKPETEPATSRLRRMGAWIVFPSILLVAACLFGWQLTEPVDISGQWTGEDWKSISLASVEEADGWYNGSFTAADGQGGVLQLEWSRLQRRYNGRWKSGEAVSGSLTLRVKGSVVRGAASVDADSPTSSTVPRLREFSWQRASQAPNDPKAPSGPDGNSVPAIPVESPIKGRIVRFFDGIYENAYVTAGTAIAEVADADPTHIQRLEKQKAAAEQYVDTMQALVVASERNVLAAQAAVESLKSQRKAYQQVKAQVVTAEDASIEAAKNKAAAGKAELAEQKAAQVQTKADYDRQKQLFDSGLVPQLRLQEAERKYKEAEAKVRRAEANILAAENETVAKQNERKAKEAKAQGDVDYAAALVNKAVAEAAKAEKELVSARMELLKGEQAAAEAVANVARQRNVLIAAPADGIITKLTSSRLVKEGGQICVLRPAEQPNPDAKDDTAPAKPASPEEAANDNSPEAATNTSPDAANDTSPDAASEARPAPRRSRIAGVPSQSGVSGLPITLAIDAATSLGRRYRSVARAMQNAQEDKDGDADQAALQEDLDAADAERRAAISIIEAQLESAKRLNTIQNELKTQVTRRIESGDLDPPSLLPAEQASLASAAEVRQFELLLKYYTKLAEADGPSEDIATAVLKIQADALTERLALYSQLSGISRARFNQGMSTIDDLLKAEQTEAMAAAELKNLKALITYYQDRSTREPLVDAELEEDGAGLLPRAGTRKRRQSFIKVLSARLTAAESNLQQAKLDLQRQKRLFETNAASAASYDAAKNAVIQAEAQVVELEAKIEYYQSYDTEEK